MVEADQGRIHRGHPGHRKAQSRHCQEQLAGLVMVHDADQVELLVDVVAISVSYGAKKQKSPSLRQPGEE